MQEITELQHLEEKGQSLKGEKRVCASCVSVFFCLKLLNGVKGGSHSDGGHPNALSHVSTLLSNDSAESLGPQLS